MVGIESASRPGLTHKVHLGEAEHCPCDARYHHPSRPCRHIILAEALLKSRSRKFRFEREVGERVVTALCKRIFAAKRESASEAYDLYCEVVGCRYSTARMRTAALRRHRRAYAVEMGRIA